MLTLQRRYTRDTCCDLNPMFFEKIFVNILILFKIIGSFNRKGKVRQVGTTCLMFLKLIVQTASLLNNFKNIYNSTVYSLV